MRHLADINLTMYSMLCTKSTHKEMINWKSLA